MTTRSDREHISILNGMEASSSTKPWKKTATPIDQPRNPPRQSGINPFNPNPNRLHQANSRSNTSVGNVTSSRTLVHSKGIGEGRPEKRRRTEGPFGQSLYSAPHVSLSNGKQHTSQGEPIIITDDENQGHSNHVSSHRPRQSSDELNIVARPSSSTNPFSGFRHSPDNRRPSHSKPPLAPDPPDEKWLERKYHHVEGALDSDHIESFDDSDGAPRRGVVKENVQKYESLEKANESGPRIDLTKAQKPRARHKMKGKLSGASAGKNVTSTSDFTSVDVVLSSSTHTPEKQNLLPVTAVFISRRFLPATNQDLEMFWSSGQTFSIKSKLKRSYNQAFKRSDCKRIKWSEPDKNRVNNPVIQITLNQDLVTIQFDITRPTWDSANYKQFVETFSHLTPLKTRPEGLWQEAQQLAMNSTSDASSKQSEVKTSHRLDELREIHERKNQNGSSLSGPRKRKEPESPLTDISKFFQEGSEKQAPSASSKRRNIDQLAEPSNLRRSARATTTAKSVQAADQDEVILVYPQGTPGAVNITNADLARLEPGEFLNDTLIEFGLKFWLKNLEAKNPELASQIHIFNSFFYKKLNQKDPQQAYESVKKWTSKIDIFKKKYIIVPINEHLHWYLAIIYEPEHVLSPAVSEAPPVRKETRASKKVDAGARQAQEAILEPLDTENEVNQTPSEAEIERNLNDEFRSSCNLQSPTSCGDDELLLRSESMDDDDDKSSAGLSYVSQEGDEMPSGQPSHNPSTSTTSLEGKGGQDSALPTAEEVPDSTEESESPRPSTGISPDLFYSKRAKGKEKERVAHDLDVHMEGPKPEDEVIFVEHPKTYIFTMDSLGTRHPQAVKRLAAYLKMEAQDKKGVEDGSSAIGKLASVPVQPNFCDCGIYLLHFAQTFIDNPQDYCHKILTQRPKSMTNKERQDAWKHEAVDKMRTNMINNILQLSAEWRKARAASVEAKKTEQAEGEADVTMVDSDNDVELISTVGLAKQGKSARRK